MMHTNWNAAKKKAAIRLARATQKKKHEAQAGNCNNCRDCLQLQDDFRLVSAARRKFNIQEEIVEDVVQDAHHAFTTGANGVINTCTTEATQKTEHLLEAQALEIQHLTSQIETLQTAAKRATEDTLQITDSEHASEIKILQDKYNVLVDKNQQMSIRSKALSVEIGDMRRHRIVEVKLSEHRLALGVKEEEDGRRILEKKVRQLEASKSQQATAHRIASAAAADRVANLEMELRTVHLQASSAMVALELLKKTNSKSSSGQGNSQNMPAVRPTNKRGGQRGGQFKWRRSASSNTRAALPPPPQQQQEMAQLQLDQERETQQLLAIILERNDSLVKEVECVSLANKAACEAIEQLSDSIQCSVCLDAKLGSVIQCGHSFCRDCVSAVTACPLCREPIVLRITLRGM